MISSFPGARRALLTICLPLLATLFLFSFFSVDALGAAASTESSSSAASRDYPYAKWADYLLSYNRQLQTSLQRTTSATIEGTPRVRLSMVPMCGRASLTLQKLARAKKDLQRIRQRVP